MENQYKKWTEQEIEILVEFMHKQIPMTYIRKALGRSERSIQHAMKNVMFQQLLSHDVDDIAAYYKTDRDHLEEAFVPSKYYVSLDKDPQRTRGHPITDVVANALKYAFIGATIVIAGTCVKYMESHYDWVVY